MCKWGKLNYCIKALRAKGLIKIENFKKNPKKLNYIYILTPKGITEKSIDSLPDNPSNLLINQSTFNIGRKSSDPFTNNSLELQDSRPLQISRNHVSFQIENNNVAVYDIGSSLGLCLNNERIGGATESNGPLFLNDKKNYLIC